MIVTEQYPIVQRHPIPHVPYRQWLQEHPQHDPGEPIDVAVPVNGIQTADQYFGEDTAYLTAQPIYLRRDETYWIEVFGVWIPAREERLILNCTQQAKSPLMFAKVGYRQVVTGRLGRHEHGYVAENSEEQSAIQKYFLSTFR